MEIGTGLTILGTALGGKDIIVKILGPTADYLGGELSSFTEKRIENIKAIFEKSEKKLGKSLEKEGFVPPKILRTILNEGSYCDDNLGQEYFAGVLANSRTSNKRDDRGITWAMLLSRLSSYQIRMHYIFYVLVYRLLKGSDINIGLSYSIHKTRIYIPWGEFVDAMELTMEEVVLHRNTILSNSVYGLVKEMLIDPKEYNYGSKELLQSFDDSIEEQGLILAPSGHGIDFFLWAHNQKMGFEEFLVNDMNYDLVKDIEIPKSARLLKQKQRPTKPISKRADSDNSKQSNLK